MTNNNSNPNPPAKNTKITKDMSFQQVLSVNPNAGTILAKHGMGCIGCVMAAFETVGQGAEAHGLDADKIIEEINNASISEKK